MLYQGLINLAGGLALFLYGLNVMEDSLRELTGGRLNRFLNELTGRKARAVAAGCLITAFLQSSSAVTVMTVGLVDAALMDLNAAAGIIMGANVGTTVTAWLLSLSGIGGREIIPMKLLQPSSLTPFLAIVGVALIIRAKSRSSRLSGSLMMGFSILMTGLDAICRAVEPLACSPVMIKMYDMIRHPCWGFLAGGLLTALLQSSSASMGILLAVSPAGALSYYNVIPVIMGQNAGTCITAILAGTGASGNAKKAALIHLYFNLIGIGTFLLLISMIRWLFAPDYLDRQVSQIGIAAIHSLYNVFTVILLYKRADILINLAEMTVK